MRPLNALIALSAGLVASTATVTGSIHESTSLRPGEELVAKLASASTEFSRGAPVGRNFMGWKRRATS